MSKKAVTEKVTKSRFPRTKFPKLVSTERKKATAVSCGGP